MVIVNLVFLARNDLGRFVPFVPLLLGFLFLAMLNIVTFAILRMIMLVMLGMMGLFLTVGVFVARVAMCMVVMKIVKVSTLIGVSMRNRRSHFRTFVQPRFTHVSLEMVHPRPGAIGTVLT